MALLMRRPVLSTSRTSRTVAPRRAVVAQFQVTFRTASGDKVLEVPDDTYLLDAAENEGIDLPYSCRGGACSSCVGKLVSGTVDQAEQQTLEEGQVANGFVLTCVAYPTSDLVILTDQASALN